MTDSNKETISELFADLVALAVEGKGSELTKEELRELYEVAKAADVSEEVEAFDLLPDRYLELLEIEGTPSQLSLSPGYDSAIVLGNRGAFLDKGDTKFPFQPVNVCPYFRPDELCILDGRICQYDSNSFPVCKRYRKGIEKKIAGIDGNVPDIKPEDHLPDLDEK